MTYRFLLNRNRVEENVPPDEFLLDIKSSFRVWQLLLRCF